MISVVIVSYNRPLYVMDALRSYIRQSYQSKELIFVDNGSTEDYTEVLSFVKTIPNCTYLHLKHNDIHKANKLGLDHTNGDIITYLHDDDMFTDDSLSMRAKPFENISDGVQVVWGDSIKLDQSNGRKWLYPSAPPNLPRQWKESYIACDSLMWRKSVHDKVGYFSTDYEFEGDFDWCLRLQLNYQGNCHYINHPVVINRLHDKRETSRNSPELFLKAQELIRQSYIKQGFKCSI